MEIVSPRAIRSGPVGYLQQLEAPPRLEATTSTGSEGSAKSDEVVAGGGFEEEEEGLEEDKVS